MDLTPLSTTFMDIAKALTGIGIGLDVLTLACAGIAMYFSWLDLHVGSLIKKVFVAVLGGNTLLGLAGAIGLFLGSKFGLT